MSNRKFFLQTFGCRLNQAESGEAERLLFNCGWQKVATADQADLILLNTCAVTRKAEKEVRQTTSRLRKINPKAKIALAGCWVDKIKKFGGLVPEGIDLMVRNKGKWKELIQSLKIKSQKNTPGVSFLTPPGWKRNPRVLIRIQTGCSNNCAYCLPRLIRGKPKSVPVKDIIARINKAVKRGTLEVVLTGQNISQYRDHGKDWINLTEEILKKTEIKLLRFGSINPSLVDDPTTSFSVQAKRLINFYQGLGKGRLSRHLHLSSQSGSGRVLKLMNRNYRSEIFLELVKLLRGGVKGINITTDIIVGFPGETEKDFLKTVRFAQKAKFGKIHIFRFSVRAGTLAAKMERGLGRVSEAIKTNRAERLAKIEKELRFKFWRSQIGKSAMAIILPGGKGLSDNYIPLMVKKAKTEKVSKIAKVKFVALKGNFVAAVADFTSIDVK
ncbi:MiaB/RimO family radical SAM methylthiotransferase [Patescibacteria group bacterium]|nr:MiaB/RimO family radical SAM methylthiotransferase [Patescibacteria group bacterium]